MGFFKAKAASVVGALAGVMAWILGGTKKEHGKVKSPAAVESSNPIRTLRVFFESGLYVVVPLLASEIDRVPDLVEGVLAASKPDRDGAVLAVTVDVPPSQTFSEVSGKIKRREAPGMELTAGSSADAEGDGVAGWMSDAIGFESARPMEVDGGLLLAA